MDAASDDLNRPLGVERSEPAKSGGLVRTALVAASVLVLALAGALGLFVAIWGDPQGGMPRVRVAIGAKRAEPTATAPSTAAPASPVQSPADATVGQPSAGRRNAGEVESASGVSVIRPDGARAPDAVIVRVPDESDLRPAEPTSGLLEQTRFGLLPKIGPGGVRPVDAYARSPGELPNGMTLTGRIALVVGGLAIGQAVTDEALSRLPPAVTLAIAPSGGDLDRLARRARQTGHEILLQVPMEPFDYPESDPGPHTILAAAKPEEAIEHLNWALGRFAGYVGVMNSMGGKVTADAGALAPVMRELSARGLSFVDDGSSSRSVATRAAGALPAVRADLVVDATGRADAIDKALAQLERIALGGRVAVGSATALPLTIERIERWSRGLAARGILLVPVTTALKRPRPDTLSR